MRSSIFEKVLETKLKWHKIFTFSMNYCQQCNLKKQEKTNMTLEINVVAFGK